MKTSKKQPSLPIGQQLVNIQMTLQEHLEYLMYLVRNNSEGIELELVMLAMLSELHPDSLIHLARMCKNGITHTVKGYSVGDVIEYEVERANEPPNLVKARITDIYYVSQILKLDNGDLITGATIVSVNGQPFIPVGF